MKDTIKSELIYQRDKFVEAMKYFAGLQVPLGNTVLITACTIVLAEAILLKKFNVTIFLARKT